ncbi:MAG: hypothetical protein OEY34_03505 [Cyclobacteriaceae bacterium]|nr:hypothetical protein [Cyclobacteriaceae bacterium]
MKKLRALLFIFTIILFYGCAVTIKTPQIGHKHGREHGHESGKGKKKGHHKNEGINIKIKINEVKGHEKKGSEHKERHGREED